MKCQNCQKNEATVHYKTNVNGTVKEAHLCADCARELGYETGFDPFGAMISDFFRPWRSGSDRSGTVCPFCGATQRSIADSGKAGCARCYDVFGDLFGPYIRRLHGSAVHTGKLPAAAGRELKQRREKERLQKELHEAVEQQRYEDAAKLRDAIKNLEQGGAEA